jgi:hypothetical protein
MITGCACRDDHQYTSNLLRVAGDLDCMLSRGELEGGAAVLDVHQAFRTSIDPEIQFPELEFLGGYGYAAGGINGEGEQRRGHFVVAHHNARVRLEPVLAVGCERGNPGSDPDFIAVILPGRISKSALG